MISEEKLQKYQDWIFQISAYQMALALISIDKMTVAPPAGGPYRDARTAWLSGEKFSLETDPEMFRLLQEMKDDPDLDGDTRRAAYLYWRKASHTICIPKEEFVSSEELTNQAYDAWYRAKMADDYSLFRPYLEKIIENKKKFYGYRGSSASIYDQMLDDNEPGMNEAKYDAFFADVKGRLIPLLRKVCAAAPIDTSFLHRNYPAAQQKKFTEEHLLPYLNYDPSWGYQNETEHPFTYWTCENDCRTTTKYLPDNVTAAIFSTVHEVGHATFEHDIDPKYDGMILSEGVSAAMHESQSRLCENYLGRTHAFWEANFPALQAEFPDQLGGIPLDDFVRASNAAIPGLLRLEADELTYPLHIVIRYEIEKDLFDGRIGTEDLEKVWNEKYREYLGVEVPNSRDGILQDVHWCEGSFGYFPTYALGSAYAAQIVHKMREDIDVDEALRSGHYERCMNWLKENVHRYGCRYDAPEIIRRATGEEFSWNYYLDDLERKYTELYHL